MCDTREALSRRFVFGDNFFNDESFSFVRDVQRRSIRPSGRNRKRGRFLRRLDAKTFERVRSGFPDSKTKRDLTDVDVLFLVSRR